MINTCSVRERAEEKLFTRLGEIRQRGARGRLAAGRRGGRLRRAAGRRAASSERSHAVDVIIGTQNIRQLPVLVERRRRAARVAHARSSTSIRSTTCRSRWGSRGGQDPVKAYVTIIEGCNEFCAFCVVPYTRGHERMRPVARDRRRGARRRRRPARSEIQLLGQIVNHYQAPDDPACDFAALLERLNDVDGLRADPLREPASAARHAADDRGDARPARRSAGTCTCRCSPARRRVLAAMRRRHTREEYLDLVARLRDAMPDIALSTDMIVGFPGETDDDFEETLSLTVAVRYHSMFSFKYSPRPNTLALKRMPDDVPEEEKTRRIVALQALQRDIQGELHAAAVGRVEDGAGGLPQPPPRLGAVGPHERQHRRELHRRPATGSGRLVPVRITGRESEQPAGRSRGAGRSG